MCVVIRVGLGTGWSTLTVMLLGDLRFRIFDIFVRHFSLFTDLVKSGEGKPRASPRNITSALLHPISRPVQSVPPASVMFTGIHSSNPFYPYTLRSQQDIFGSRSSPLNHPINPTTHRLAYLTTAHPIRAS